nr:hypothetical protein [Tanacetum cinerariifolium]
NALPNNEVHILENVIGQGSTNTRDVIARAIQSSLPKLFQQNKEEILKDAEENTIRMMRTRIERETVADNHHLQEPEHPEPVIEKDCSYKEFIGTKPTVYYGKGGPIVAMDWLSNIKICFETCRATHEIAQAAKLPWEEFKEMLKEKYFPRSETLKLEIEFLRLEMGNDTIQEYTDSFVKKS